MIKPGQIWKIRKGAPRHRATGSDRVRIKNASDTWVGVARWIATKERFSTGGFGLTPEAFLELYELESSEEG